MKRIAQPYNLDLKRLLPVGAVGQIATELGLNASTVGLALKAGKPSHPAVQLAIKMAMESGAFATAQALARLQPKR